MLENDDPLYENGKFLDPKLLKVQDTAKWYEALRTCGGDGSSGSDNGEKDATKCSAAAKAAGQCETT